jgi:hypothetical protein
METEAMYRDESLSFRLWIGAQSDSRRQAATVFQFDEDIQLDLASRYGAQMSLNPIMELSHL